jgi:hypothetical protein
MTSGDLAPLIARYRDAARRHGVAKTSRAANRAAVELAGIHRELRAHGSAALEQIMPLLQDQDASVRGWAAAHALQFAPQQAAAVLEELAAGPFGPIRASASMTLREWRAGRLQFP